MLKDWKLKDKLAPDFLNNLLALRGISESQKEKFLSPDYESEIHNPFLIKGMDEAAARVIQAIENNKTLGIASDYDADGVCSASVFISFLAAVQCKNYILHIPDRNLDGYGLTKDVVRNMKKRGVNLILTLDSGITNDEEITLANSLGIDVIVVDHHEPPEKLPPAFAVLNPKQKGETYPFDSLCGAGLTFKLVSGIIQKKDFGLPRGWEKWLLDLTAIATIADMVPLRGENRVLVYYGLKVLRRTRRHGLKALYVSRRLSPSCITEEDVAFSIAPRINLAGRMSHAKLSFDLMASESGEEAQSMAEELEALASGRKDAVTEIMEGVRKLFSKSETVPVIVAGHPSWHPGVLGLAANKIVEYYKRPAFLWGQGAGENVKGSCRTDGSVDLVNLMRAMPTGYFTEFGGHSMAGGFTLAADETERLPELIFEAYSKVGEEKKGEELQIDMAMDLADINWETMREIEKLSPFGMDNPKPVFLFKKVLVKDVKYFGAGKTHLRLFLESNNSKDVQAVGFFASPHFWEVKEKLIPGEEIDLAASLESSFWKNTHELRLRVIDVR